MGKNNKKKTGNKKSTNPSKTQNKNNSTKDELADDDDDDAILELAMKENESYVPPVKKAFTLPPAKDSKYPFVSVCTPTYNRRPFISAMLKCFDHQDYPKHRMEWIIVDDGTDKVEELVKDHPNVRYFKYDEKMTLGKKRNIVHDKSVGDILVYMDDDDYYPPQRVSHAVDMLQKNPQALCAGCSELYIYFKHIQKMYQFGPYKPNHGTAGTFAFRREMLKDNRYDEDACLAEEKSFLKDYTVPFVQLDPKKVILVFSHEQNTFDKRKLLDNANPQFVKESDKKIDDFIKEKELKEFYLSIDSLLEDYSPGDPAMKPDVLKQMIKLEETRRKNAEQQLNNYMTTGQTITLQQEGQPPTTLKMPEIIELIKQQQSQLQQFASRISQHEQLNKALLEKLKAYENKQDGTIQQTLSADTTDPSNSEVPTEPSADTADPSNSEVPSEPSADTTDPSNSEVPTEPSAD
jgi:glycosyltransferase involved in cell wall biosynthesis